MGLTELAGDAGAAGAEDLAATVISIFAVAIGVLVGTLVLTGATATGRFVQEASGATDADERSWLPRTVTRLARRRSPGSDGGQGDR